MSPNEKTILPKVALGDADIHRVAAPKRRWRIIGGAFSDYAEEHFDTQAERDQAAQAMADKFRETVLCEFWSFSHQQDELNRGWACDGTINPRERS